MRKPELSNKSLWMRALQRKPKTRRERQSLKYKRALAKEFEQLLAGASGRTRFHFAGSETGRLSSKYEHDFLGRAFHEGLFPELVFQDTDFAALELRSVAAIPRINLSDADFAKQLLAPVPEEDLDEDG